MNFQPLALKKGEDRRIRAGHLWVFSNEVDIAKTPLDAYVPGQPVVILASNGNPLGTGYVNPHSLICARLVSRDLKHLFDVPLIAARLGSALSLREQLFEHPFYRLVYGESDGLPGLVVDRYGDVLVMQITTAGIERIKTDVIELLRSLLNPSAILLRNDTPSRSLEGLPQSVEIVYGQMPEQILLPENGCNFEVPLLAGQKTGWFFDHRLNRERMLRYIGDRRVLDVFSYLGGWGIAAAVGGARHVHCLETSEAALEYLHRNAVLNQVEHKITPVRGDAFEQMRALHDHGERFDVVITDPPAFIKRKKDLKEGTTAYQRLNQLAVRLLREGGFLISSSCSHHLSPGEFGDIIRRSAMRAGREIQIIEQGHQGPDHPIHPAMPETNYLKTLICRIMPSSRGSETP
jgi:23S rRNA (cytosine1962-C5)-methyltransferase